MPITCGKLIAELESSYELVIELTKWVDGGLAKIAMIFADVMEHGVSYFRVIIRHRGKMNSWHIQRSHSPDIRSLQLKRGIRSKEFSRLRSPHGLPPIRVCERGPWCTPYIKKWR